MLMLTAFHAKIKNNNIGSNDNNNKMNRLAAISECCYVVIAFILLEVIATICSNRIIDPSVHSINRVCHNNIQRCMNCYMFAFTFYLFLYLFI